MTANKLTQKQKNCIFLQPENILKITPKAKVAKNLFLLRWFKLVQTAV